MKPRIKYANKPRTTTEHDRSVAEANEFHANRMNQKRNIKTKRESSNKPAGNDEYEQAIAEDVNFNNDAMIAETAYFIGQRRDDATGNAQSDWIEAETNVEGLMITPLINRRIGATVDRRRSAITDRRIGVR